MAAFDRPAISMGTSGWLVLAEVLPLKQQFGVVRVAAPLAGSNPRIDDKHSRWLHVRIRPSTLPFLDPAKSGAYGKVKTKALVDGRWTMAFRDEESCKSALSMILEEAKLQSNEVERRLKPLFDLEKPVESSNPSVIDAVPCRIAFERGKERHFSFLAISMGTSGWLVLAEVLPLKQQFGVVRVAAPLAGSNPRIDDKHSRWLHVRIRPSTLPFLDPAKSGAYGKVKTKALVDGRWTMAFRDEESCKSALSMILEEAKLQSNEVERRLKPLFDLEKPVESSNPSVRAYKMQLKGTV
ncbi:protein transparent testa 9 [Quercus suber]|uniref:Protein transparent testa 9 n=1 Tax=Quercus suber TaxID=58331 RepID=A0AAW0M8J7_QUESU